MYADLGPWATCTSAYDRSQKPGNNVVGATANGSDPRLLAFRHGTGKTSGLKINAVFFDGHGETLNEINACNPKLWVPRGSFLPNGSTAMWPDVYKQYKIVPGSTYLVN